MDKARARDRSHDELISIREVPNTFWDNLNTYFKDARTFFSEYKRFFITLFIFIAFFGGLILIHQSRTSDKTVIAVFFEIIGKLIVFTWNITFPYILVFALSIALGYNPVKKLLRKQMISINEFRGEREEVLTMREGEGKVILYKRRGLIETLLRGKEPIEIDSSTYDYIKSISETKKLVIDGEEIDILRINIIPRSYLPDQELFMTNNLGIKSLNTTFLIAQQDIEEFIAKSNLPGSDIQKLQDNLFGLTVKLNKSRQRVAAIERNYQYELDDNFWGYVSYNCFTDRQAQKNLRNLNEQLAKEDNGLPSGMNRQHIKEYLQVVKRMEEEKEMGGD